MLPGFSLYKIPFTSWPCILSGLHPLQTALYWLNLHVVWFTAYTNCLLLLDLAWCQVYSPYKLVIDMWSGLKPIQTVIYCLLCILSAWSVFYHLTLHLVWVTSYRIYLLLLKLACCQFSAYTNYPLPLDLACCQVYSLYTLPFTAWPCLLFEIQPILTAFYCFT